MADWNGVPFLLLLFSADRFNERAIFFGSFDLNTPDSRSSASLVCITRRDHFFFGAAFLAVFFRATFLRAVAALFFVAVAFFFLCCCSHRNFLKWMQP
jgi:hypothetical protein